MGLFPVSFWWLHGKHPSVLRAQDELCLSDLRLPLRSSLVSRSARALSSPGDGFRGKSRQAKSKYAIPFLYERRRKTYSILHNTDTIPNWQYCQ